jgi:putative PIN family toxin of toxin-antitoxin system
MSRLVLDTNVLVSAFLTPTGNESHVLRLALSPKHQLFVSDDMVEEYRRILSKSKFKFRVKDLEEFFAFLNRQAIIVVPGKQLHVSPDEADNRFLECSEAASADYLVTGNKKHFPVKWKTTRVVNAREWLEATLSF